MKRTIEDARPIPHHGGRHARADTAWWSGSPPRSGPPIPQRLPSSGYFATGFQPLPLKRMARRQRRRSCSCGAQSAGEGGCGRRRNGVREPVPTTKRSSTPRAVSTRTAPGLPRTVRPARATPGFTARNAVSSTSRSLSTAAVRHSARAEGLRPFRLPSSPPGDCHARTTRSSASRARASAAALCRAARLPRVPVTPTTTLRTTCSLSSPSGHRSRWKRHEARRSHVLYGLLAERSTTLTHS